MSVPFGERYLFYIQYPFYDMITRRWPLAEVPSTKATQRPSYQPFVSSIHRTLQESTHELLQASCLFMQKCTCVGFTQFIFSSGET